MATAALSSVVPAITDKLGDLSITASPQTETATAFARLLKTDLQPKLSAKAKIVFRDSDGESEGYEALTERWSDHNKPSPAVVVCVATEEDVCAVVKFANSSVPRIPILAQSGGHGFAASILTLPSQNSIVINMRALKSVNVDLEKGTATVGGGVLTGEVLRAAEEKGAHVMTGICNTVGLIPALMGGGMGVQMSLYGLGVDNILSARLVLASGEVVALGAGSEEDEEKKELFWALRGAGTNFGIVTELVLKAYPEVNGGQHFIGTLGWPGSKEMAVTIMKTIIEMGIGRGMGLCVIWARVPGMGAMIFVNTWYAGPTAEAKEKYEKLYAITPTAALDMGSEVSYAHINDPNDPVCAPGGRKPMFPVAINTSYTPHINGAGAGTGEPAAEHFSTATKFGEAYEEWLSFSASEEGAFEKTPVLIECYGYGVVRETDDGATAYPWRGEVDCMAFTSPNYESPSHDALASAHGARFRDILNPPTSEETRKVYMNFANGDEPLEQLYGGEERMERLRSVKKRWDGEGVWGFYHKIV